jgi:hypothetical protein
MVHHVHLAAYLHRKRGIKLILVSGVRESTFVGRLPYLPLADAYIIENGGRILYPSAEAIAAAEASTNGYATAPDRSTMTEDLQWRSSLQDVCGSADSNDKCDAAQRVGPLWDLCRDLVSEGWHVDTGELQDHTLCRSARVACMYVCSL